MAKAIVLGGGIVGLSSAYYLHQSGWQVTLLDKEDFNNNCSYGNAGYICPSHFVPLASPGIIKQGLRWILNPESPFYVQPRLSSDLISWGLKFMKSATPANLVRNAIPLRDIAVLSKKLYEEWLQIPGFDFAYAQKGLLEYFQSAAKEEYAHHHAEEAVNLGLDARVLSAAEVQAMEPRTKLNIKGALYFACDAHLHPNKVMQQMQQYLRSRGVQFVPHAEATGFEAQGKKITKVKTKDGAAYEADLVVIATGSWSKALAKQVGANLPMVGGRGYSMTFENSDLKLDHPAVLMEGRVALTPFNENTIRLGGTMEITSLSAPPRMSRVRGIINAAKGYFPEATIPVPALKDVWYGYRPCSADGMPFIGRAHAVQNCIVATGHAMVGMSLGAATGKLVSELADEHKPSVDLMPYSLYRFE